MMTSSTSRRIDVRAAPLFFSSRLDKGSTLRTLHSFQLWARNAKPTQRFNVRAHVVTRGSCARAEAKLTQAFSTCLKRPCVCSLGIRDKPYVQTRGASAMTSNALHTFSGSSRAHGFSSSEAITIPASVSRWPGWSTMLPRPAVTPGTPLTNRTGASELF